MKARAAQDGILLTEEQLAALEKAKQQKEAHGEIESHHPGYLSSRNTYHVGTMKGVGRIYRQTFIDTDARVAICKLYNEKTAIIKHPNRTASLHPSVWRKKDCGSHFWFRKGRVHWVRPHR